MNVLLAVLKDTRTYIASIGIFLSVILHELFHVAVHWGSIKAISVFPNVYTIVEIQSTGVGHYDTTLEELFAYTITLITLLITALAITGAHDRKDTKSFSKTILPKHSELHSLTEAELLELAMKTNVFKIRI